MKVEIVGDSRGLEKALGKSQGGLKGFGQSMKSAGSSLTRNLTAPIAGLGFLAGREAVKWESAFAGVRKTVDATEKDFARLSKGLRQTAKDIPVTAVELAGLAEAAGQLGIKRKNILGFVRTMADLGEATNLSGEQAADSLARLANITRMPQKNFDRLGSTIVDLGNKLAATEAEIVEMGLRIAGAGNQIGLTESQVLAFAGALTSVGINAEAGGTAISTTFLKMNSAVKGGGDALSGFAKVAGVSGGEFAKRFEKDAAGASIMFIEGLRRIKGEGGDVSSTLKDLGLGGIRVQDTLLRASGAGDLFRKSLKIGSTAWKENNALTEEARKRYKTTESQLRILGNILTDVGITIGSAFLPPLVKVAKTVGEAIGPAVEWFGKLPEPIKLVGASLIGLAAVAGPIVFTLGAISVAIAAISAPVAIVAGAAVALAAGGALLAANWGKVAPVFGQVGQVFASAMAGIKDALNLSSGDLQRFGQGIQNVFTLATNVVRTYANVWRSIFEGVILPVAQRVLPGVVQIVQGALRVIGGIVKVWSGVLTLNFGKAWDGVKQIFSGQLKAIGGLVRAATAPLRAAFAAAWGPMKSVAKSAMNAVVDVVANFTAPFRQTAAGVARGVGAGFSVVKGLVLGPVRGGFNAALDFVRGLAGKAKAAAAKVVTGFVSAFRGIASKVEATLRPIIRVIESIVNAVNTALDKIDSLANKIPSLPDTGGGVPFVPGVRRGGLVFRGGGLVPAVLSPGEVGVTPGGGAFKVPGPRVAADTVPMMLPTGTAVLTNSGQRMMAGGASLGDAIKHQAPHFATGGYVRGAKAASAAGFRGRKLHEAVAIGGAESVDYTDMTGDASLGGSYGPWMVHHPSHPQYDTRRLQTDWTYAAKAAYAISGGGRNWNPWTVYRTGAYKSRLDEAAAAIKRLGKGATQGSVPDRDVTKVTPAPTTFPLLGNMLAPLVEDSLMGGIERGREGASRRGFLTEILEGIVPESGDRATREQVSIPGRKGASRGTGGPATGPIAARLAKMQAFGDKYHGRPYVYGGGHGALGVPSGNPPSFDCSGYVSGILAAGGALSGSPLTTVSLMGWGKPGKGKNVTVGVRGGAGKTGHTMMQVGNQFYESGSSGVGRRSGWSGSFTTWRHPAWRKGGIVGMRKGGIVPASPEGKRHLAKLAQRKGVPVSALLDPASKMFVGWGMRRGGVLDEIAEGDFDFQNWLRRGKKPDRKPSLATLIRILGANQLGSRNADFATRTLSERVQGRSIGSLLSAQKRARQQIRKMSRKGFTGPERIRTRRLRGAISLLQDQMGRPIGRQLGMSDRAQERISRQQQTFQDRMIVSGIDPESIQGMEAERGEAMSAVGVLSNRRAGLVKMLNRAKKTGNKKAQAEVQAEIDEVDDQVLNLTSSIKQLDQAIREAMPTAKDFANRDLALARLTDDLSDDLSALQRLEQIEKQALDAALQTADPRDDIEAAQNLKGVRDEIKSLNESLQERDKRLADLIEEQVKNQRTLIRYAETQGPALQNMLAQMLNGAIGGNAGLGRSFPSYAGLGGLART